MTRPPFLFIKLFCCQDGGIALYPPTSPVPQPLQKDNNPSPRTKLASPRKRGGGTADIIFWLAVQYSDSPTFTILKLFRAVTVGIVNASEAFMLALLSISIPFDPHQPFQNRTIPCSALPHSPLLSKVRCCRPKEFGRLPEGLPRQPFAPH